MSSSKESSVLELPKLQNSKEYIHRRRREYAYIRQNDVELLGFQSKPTNASATVRERWLEAMIKAKTAIILNLVIGPLD